VFACGETEKAINYLKFYSNRRLLGEHVPYAIEAWPEGSQRHLSAESGLYCRIITEGMFGIRPTGLHAFTFTPRLPKDWDHMSLNKIGAFGHSFDIAVKRAGTKLNVIVSSEGKTVYKKNVKEGEAINIKL
jgi:cellobiose phosphorylase